MSPTYTESSFLEILEFSKEIISFKLVSSRPRTSAFTAFISSTASAKSTNRLKTPALFSERSLTSSTAADSSSLRSFLCLVRRETRNTANEILWARLEMLELLELSDMVELVLELLELLDMLGPCYS